MDGCEYVHIVSILIRAWFSKAVMMCVCVSVYEYNISRVVCHDEAAFSVRKRNGNRRHFGRRSGRWVRGGILSGENMVVVYVIHARWGESVE